MKPQQVDYINIGLMIFSFFLAILMPFKLFLFSYAVLGPLHYLTEIGWLKKQQYFIKKKSDYLWLVLLCLVVTFGALTYEFRNWSATVGIYNWFNKSVLSGFFAFLVKWQANFIFISFVAALAFTIFNKMLYKILLIAAGTIFATILTLNGIKSVYLIFGVFVPTILHVSLFTAAFILYGAMKGKKFSGYLSFGVFIICVLAFFVVEIDAGNYQIGQYIKDTFSISKFDRLGPAIGSLFTSDNLIFSFDSNLMVRIQAFIAFSYTYHYLNWFSKTSIIKWHDVPKEWIAASVLIWLSSMALYLYNYRIGLMALFFLSLLHVFLEFPLNHRTFIFIGNELWKKITRRSSTIPS